MTVNERIAALREKMQERKTNDSKRENSSTSCTHERDRN